MKADSMRLWFTQVHRASLLYSGEETRFPRLECLLFFSEAVKISVTLRLNYFISITNLILYATAQSALPRVLSNIIIILYIEKKSYNRTF